MRKLYEEKEVMFAVLWIVLYCVIVGTARGNFGDESVHMLLALLVFAAAITVFVKSNHLEEKYGLAGWPKDIKKYLFFIPMWILATGNIWGGFALSCRGTALIFSVSSMILVGYVEEMIFRGFLLRAMLAGNTSAAAIIVSALTFGVGHIINLFTGHGSFETIMQILFAVSLGFLFTMVCYKSGSIIPCIIAHSVIDVLSRFATDNELFDWIYIIATIVVSIVYCIYLSRLDPANEEGRALSGTEA